MKAASGHVALDELLALADIDHGQRCAAARASALSSRAVTLVAPGGLRPLQELVAVETCVMDLPPAAGHGGHDGNLVGGAHGRVQALQAAHLVVVDKHVDKTLDVAVVVQQLIGHAGYCASIAWISVPTSCPSISTLAWPPVSRRSGVGIKTVAMFSDLLVVLAQKLVKPLPVRPRT
jgi:hypothetical protein